jgi:hypothetical protein
LSRFPERSSRPFVQPHLPEITIAIAYDNRLPHRIDQAPIRKPGNIRDLVCGFKDNGWGAAVEITGYEWVALPAKIK